MQVDTRLYDVSNTLKNTISYRLLFLRPLDPNVIRRNIINENVPPEVELISSSYPIFPGVVVASLIDCYGPSYFWIPRRKTGQSAEEYNILIREYKQHNFAKYIGYNDLETSLNMWHDLTATIGGIHRSQKGLVTWARDNSINNKKIRELLQIVEQSVNALIRLGYEVQIGPFTTQGVMNAIRPVLLSVYSDLTLIHRRGLTYFNSITKEDYKLDNRDAVNELAVNPPSGIIALVTAEIKIQRGVFRVIGFGVDTDKDGLGRIIIVKDSSIAPRGPRTIVHNKQIGNSNNGLDIMSKTNMDKDVSEEDQANISSALDLLKTIRL